MITKLDDGGNKRKKLKGFENWSQWTNLIPAILKEKEVWDVIDGMKLKSTIVAQIKKKDKDNAITSKIIK